MKKHNLCDIGLIFIFLSLAFTIANNWIDIPKDIIYCACLFGALCNWLDNFKNYRMYLNYYKLKKREAADLEWSYREMGKYIKKFNLQELYDLDLRIDNEMQDISVRKKNLAKQLGINEKDLDKI